MMHLIIELRWLLAGAAGLGFLLKDRADDGGPELVAGRGHMQAVGLITGFMAKRVSKPKRKW